MFHFTANLKPYTFRERPVAERFDAYLLSADYVGSLADMATEVRDEERELIADNGNVDLLRRFARDFRPAADALGAERKEWESRHGRYARPGDLPPTLARKFAALAKEVAAANAAEVTDDYAAAAVGRQASISPSFLVGMEDLTVGALAALDMEPEYMGLPQTFYEERIANAVGLAQRTKNGELGAVRGGVLAGLQAIDFDTAVLAGRMAAEADVDGVAVGLFGALTDRSYVDFRVQDGEIIELGQRIPRPYHRGRRPRPRLRLAPRSAAPTGSARLPSARRGPLSVRLPDTAPPR